MATGEPDGSGEEGLREVDQVTDKCKTCGGNGKGGQMSFTCAGCRGAGTYPQHYSRIPILCWACNGRGVNDYPTWRDPATHIVYKQNVEGESMNKRDLDRHITGNGGEDQYPDDDNCWECPRCGVVYWPPTKSCSSCNLIIKVDDVVDGRRDAEDDDGC